MEIRRVVVVNVVSYDFISIEAYTPCTKTDIIYHSYVHLLRLQRF